MSRSEIEERVCRFLERIGKSTNSHEQLSQNHEVGREA